MATADAGEAVQDEAGDALRAAKAAGQECLAAALDFLSRGWSALACCPPDHVGVGKVHGKNCKNPGKVPFGSWKEYQDRLPTDDELRDKWRGHPQLNVSIATGPVSGLVGIDVDGDGGEAALRTMSGRDLPPTLEFLTPGGGRRLLYAIPPGVTFRQNQEPLNGKHEEVRFLAKGRQTVMPPSRHPSGGRYAWTPGHGPGEIEAAPAPAWLVERLTVTNGKPHERAKTLADGELIGDGRRISTLASLAGTMRRRGFSGEAIEAALLTENAGRGDPPLEEDEVRRIAACISRYEPAEEPEGAADPEIHLTDDGNGKRMVRRHGKDLRYCWPRRKWFAFQGGRWAADTEGAAVSAAKETIRGLYRWTAAGIDALEPDVTAAGDKADPEKVKRLRQLHAVQKWCLKSEAAPRLNAMVELARSEDGIPIMPDDMNRDPWLFNCPNGTLDLRIGLLREQRREDLITQLCTTAYDAQAEAPRWCEFLREVFDDDGELIAWLQRFLGHCLTGDVSEQILPIFWGGGANGKSTLINAVQDVLGEDYAIKANRDLFMQKKHDSHPAQIARLFGKRLVVCTETGEGARLDEVLVKELTGGDKLAGRGMFENWWEFWPTFKPVLVTNHRPEVRGSDEAIWRRPRLVPFTVTFNQDKQDKQLGCKLRAEAPGILRWLVEGCLAWQRGGLGCPAVVMAATEEYRNEQDRIGLFLADRCQVHREYRAKVSELYAAYQQWAKRNGEAELSGQAFGRAMRERGFTKDDGKRWYLGIGLLAEDEA